MGTGASKGARRLAQGAQLLNSWATGAPGPQFYLCLPNRAPRRGGWAPLVFNS